MLFKRVISAIIFFIILTLFIFLGSFPFYLFVCILTLLGLNEYVNMLDDRSNKDKIILLFLGIFIVSYTYLYNLDILSLPFGLLFVIIFMVLFIYHITIFSYNDIIYKLGTNLLGLIYIGGGMSILLLLRNFSYLNLFESSFLWLALIATWATDIGAYFIGIYFGEHNLTSKISPNKTIEGALGGILFNITAILIFTIFLDIFNFSWIIYGFLSAIIAIIGDLFESSIKRDMDVKDSGSLMPGHGGILDRFDSLIFTGAFTYFFIIILF